MVERAFGILEASRRVYLKCNDGGIRYVGFMLSGDGYTGDQQELLASAPLVCRFKGISFVKILPNSTASRITVIKQCHCSSI